jgi:DNA-directed RNA polymerase subunit RPC12/RpoP
MKIAVKYMCACCKKMVDEASTFDLNDEVVCDICFGGRFFSALERLGYIILKSDVKLQDRRNNKKADNR